MSRGLWFVVAYHAVAWVTGTAALTLVAVRRGTAATVGSTPAIIMTAAFAASAVGFATGALAAGVVRASPLASGLPVMSLPAIPVVVIVALTSALTVGLVVLELAVARVDGRVDAGHERVGNRAGTTTRSLGAVTTWIGLLMIGGAAEEFLWRGVLVGAVIGGRVQAGELLGALGFGGFLFGCSHLAFGPRNVALKTVAGAAWTLLYLSAGLAPTCASHALFNAVTAVRSTRTGRRRGKAVGDRPPVRPGSRTSEKYGEVLTLGASHE